MKLRKHSNSYLRRECLKNYRQTWAQNSSIKKLRRYLRVGGIHWIATENETKVQIVERFNRTMKDRMCRYFTANKTKHWLNVLPQLIEDYDTSYHRYIKMTPIEASKIANESRVWENLYGDVDPRVVSTLKVGDHFRIFKLRGKFKRGYTSYYTDEVFTISKVLPTNSPTYQIIDKQGETITGAVYKELS